MVNDLKKFGLPNVKNIKIENLRPGFGETVCQLIDELVNIELYRREFEFLPPSIPPDETSDNSGEEYDNEHAINERYTGKNEIINGIEIHQHSMTSPGQIIGNKTKRSMAIVDAEETKVNFFNPNKQKGQYNDEKQEEDHQILETKIDPLEWNKEIDRVYKDLVKIDQEVQILKKQGGDASDFDEYLRHLELIVEMCYDIKTASHHDVRKVFEKSIEAYEEQLTFIRRNEIRINYQNEKAITELGSITQKKKKLATELRGLISRVKDYDYENKELQSAIRTLNNTYDEKMQDLGGQGQLQRIKQSLVYLRGDIRH